MSVSHLLLLPSSSDTLQFLNSVISSIGKGDRVAPTTAPKRKAEEDPYGHVAKANKPGLTARPSIAANGASTIPQTSATSHASSTRGSSVSATSSAVDSPSAAGAVKPPKKGSFKEIMARKKAEQAKLPIGAIGHRPKEKPELTFKKERKLKKKGLRIKRRVNIQAEHPTKSSDGNKDGVTKPRQADTAKNKPQLAYGGTAKPRIQPSYKGTAGAKTASSQKDAILKVKARPNVNEYAGTDDEIDSGEEGVGDGYSDEESDEESDDMEAGYSDVEEEESAALKLARKEDEEQLRLEAQLKKEKEERRKRLEALSKKVKPQRF